MNDVCYTLTIKQKTCQTTIGKTFDNVYTNIPVGTVIPLQFGYTLKYISGTALAATVQLINPIFIPTLNFNIPDNTFKIFDLPCECASYRVFVGAILSPCFQTCTVS